MYYSFDNLPKEYKVNGQRLWAFDFANSDSEKTKSLRAEPYLCEFGGWGDDKTTSTNYCYKVKKNNKRSSSSVRSGSRHYALTEKEATEGYNGMIMETIEFLLRLAKLQERHFIKLEGEINE